MTQFFHKRLRILHSVQQSLRLCPVGDLDLSVLISVKSSRKRLSAALWNKLGIYAPVFFGLEGSDLVFTVNDHANGNRLYTSCGKSPADLLRQKRAELITHQTVKDPSCLLGIHQINIDLSGRRHSVFNACVCDLIKCNTVVIFEIQPQKVGKMPGDCLSFTIGVGRKIDIIAFFGELYQLIRQFFLALDEFILRGKFFLNIHAEPVRVQITYVSHRGDDFITRSEIFFDSLCLCRRLNDNKL